MRAQNSPDVETNSQGSKHINSFFIVIILVNFIYNANNFWIKHFRTFSCSKIVLSFNQLIRHLSLYTRRNLIKSSWFDLIRLKFDLIREILVWFNNISKRFLCVYLLTLNMITLLQGKQTYIMQDYIYIEYICAFNANIYTYIKVIPKFDKNSSDILVS